jgi:hypothetical protein
LETKIKLKHTTVFHVENHLRFAPAHAAGARRRREPPSPFRAQVAQTSESKDTADIRRQLSITTISHTSGKDNIGQPQSDRLDAPLSPSCRSTIHTHAQSLPRDMLTVKVPAQRLHGIQPQGTSTQETHGCRISIRQSPASLMHVTAALRRRTLLSITTSVICRHSVGSKSAMVMTPIALAVSHRYTPRPLPVKAHRRLPPTHSAVAPRYLPPTISPLISQLQKQLLLV